MVERITKICSLRMKREQKNLVFKLNASGKKLNDEKRRKFHNAREQEEKPSSKDFLIYLFLMLAIKIRIAFSADDN